MRHALIAIATMGILAPTAWVVPANAQAEINPNIYPPYRGAPVAQQPWEWYASVGPVRRGNQCVVDVDINRGYGFVKNCPAPQASAPPRQSRAAHRYHRKVVYR